MTRSSFLDNFCVWLHESFISMRDRFIIKKLIFDIVLTSKVIFGIQM